MVKHIVLFRLSLISMLIPLRSNRAVISCELRLVVIQRPCVRPWGDFSFVVFKSSQLFMLIELEWTGMDISESWCWHVHGRATRQAKNKNRESSHQPCRSVRRGRIHHSTRTTVSCSHCYFIVKRSWIITPTGHTTPSVKRSMIWKGIVIITPSLIQPRWLTMEHTLKHCTNLCDIEW